MSSSKANKVKTNKHGESALHVAIKKGDYERAKSLINESDADVNMKDNAGEFKKFFRAIFCLLVVLIHICVKVGK